jgi:hypothetical protein
MSMIRAYLQRTEPAHQWGGPMEPRNERELANTRKKLEQLKALYDTDEVESGRDEELREAEMESLKRLINQLSEEIARYEVHQRLGSPS